MPELRLNTHLQHDNDMQDALPRRKMFSSSPVGHETVVDNKGEGARIVKRLAKVIESDGKLKNLES